MDRRSKRETEDGCSLQVKLRKREMWCKSKDFNILTLRPLKATSLISSCIITPEAHNKVIRMKEMINNGRSFWLLNRFSSSEP